jgi:hypothetical protein
MTGSAPAHPPEAVHAVAFVDDHVNVALPPLAMVVGVAVNVMDGADAPTVTVADCAAVPPAPVQVSV